MKKIKNMNEIAWVLGIVLCALGVCLMTKADFGLSMIAAPAYILHTGFIKIFPWYTQGTSEYIFQGVLLFALCIALRRFRFRYLLSFVTAVLFGLMLDGWFFVFGGNGAYEELAVRILAFVAGELITGVAIAFFFRTRLPLQIYELVVTELSDRYGWKNTTVKQIYDIVSLFLSVALAFFVNHSMAGIGVGTVIVAAVNAPLIALFGKLLDKVFVFNSLFKKNGSDAQNGERIEDKE
ncbi:MAG: hypothetical protein J1E35_09065 [Lachnospiraceae bacterium]|nr:hypothetical protein [Lachnospiraceae bacterium]